MNKTLDKLTYVDQAENVVRSLKKDKHDNLVLKTNKIRNVLTLVNELYNLMNKTEKKLSQELQSRVQYVRMRIVYEAGREDAVKDFCEKSSILDYLKDIGDSAEKLMLVCNYTEALVAYHRYYSNER